MLVIFYIQLHTVIEQIRTWLDKSSNQVQTTKSMDTKLKQAWEDTKFHTCKLQVIIAFSAQGKCLSEL